MVETDERLLADAQRELSTGRCDAFESLLARYEKLIYHIAYRYFRHSEDALDVSQEVVIRIFKGLSRVKPGTDGSIKSWVCAVTVNACLDELRKRGNRWPSASPREADKTVENAAMISSPSAEETVIARERVTEITDAINKLPEHYRTLIILRDMNGLSYQALAETTGVRINTVKSRLSRARDALWQKLSKK